MRASWQVAIGILAALAAAPAPEPPIVAETGPPRFDDLVTTTPLRLWPRERYERETAGYALQVPIERDPALGAADARYGTIPGDPATMVTFVVRFDGDVPVSLIADANRNGDLRDDAVHGFGAHEAGGRAAFELAQPWTPLQLVSDPRLGEQRDRLAYLAYRPAREGTVEVGGRAVRFAVAGSFGVYGAEHDPVYFDANGDGAVDRSLASTEAYFPGEPVHLAGRAFAFEVASDGGRLTLVPLEAPVPERPSLAVGTTAPDFAYLGMDGSQGRLSDHRGRTVLLYFWSTTCGPCRADTPGLLDAWARHHESGFDILAVARDERPEHVRAYVEHHGMEWTQVPDGRDGPVSELYRVRGTPTSFLVGPDGTIVARELRGEGIAATLDATLECAVD